MDFDTAFNLLVSPQVEGGYSDHPDDNGGKTMYGITEAEARRVGYRGNMADLPLNLAKSIYFNEYWKPLNIDALPEVLRYLVFDAGVNSGVSLSARWLQGAVGAKLDGIIGPQTLAAVQAADANAVARRMLAKRLRFMTALDDWRVFGRGWARRIALLLEQ